jgi:HAD superfamily hydrolase (TIGR01662 family)
MQVFSAQGMTLPRQFKSLIFDAGSTLIYFDGEWTDTIPLQDAALADALQAGGLAFDRDSFLARFRTRLQEYYAERETEFIEYTTAYILRTVLEEQGCTGVFDGLVPNALAAMYAVTQAYWKAEPEAHTVLQSLKRQGYRLGVISNAGDDADVQTLIDQSELRPYFEVILTSAAEGIRKPNPQIFWTALEKLGVKPGQAAMIGDTLGADILGAKNAGLYSIWITRHADTPANRAHAETILPDASIDHLGELEGLLETLKAAPGM